MSDPGNNRGCLPLPAQILASRELLETRSSGTDPRKAMPNAFDIDGATIWPIQIGAKREARSAKREARSAKREARSAKREAQSRAEQSRAEQSRAEQSRATP